MVPQPAPSSTNRLESLKSLWDIQKSAFDAAMTYSKAMLALGYGGFFALWGMAKSHLGPRAVMWSALLMGISLLLYVLFELVQTFLASLILSQFVREFHQLGQLMAEQGLYIRRSQSSTKLLSVWPYVFVSASLIGLSGAGVLIWSIIKWIHYH